MIFLTIFEDMRYIAPNRLINLKKRSWKEAVMAYFIEGTEEVPGSWSGYPSFGL